MRVSGNYVLVLYYSRESEKHLVSAGVNSTSSGPNLTTFTPRVYYKALLAFVLSASFSNGQ